MFQFGQEASKYAYGNVFYNISTGLAAATTDQTENLGEITTVDAAMGVTTALDPIRYVKINKSTDGDQSAAVITNNVALTLPPPNRMSQQFLTIQTDGWDNDKALTVVDPTEALTLTDVVEGTKHAFLLFYSDGIAWHLVSTNDVNV